MITLAVLLVVSGAVVLWRSEAQRAAAAAAEIERARFEQGRATVAAATLERQVAAMKKEIAGLQTKPVGTATPASGGSAAAAPRPANLNLEVLFAEHPEWRALYEAMSRANYQLRYAGLIHALGLSEAQRDLFTAAMARHEEKGPELTIVAQKEGWAPNDPRTRALFEKEDERLAAEMAVLLGEAGSQRFQDYDRTARLRDLVGELAVSLASIEAPLSPEAAEKLTQALARNAGTWMGKADRAKIQWEAALAEARAFLPPAQFAELERVREMEEAQRRLDEVFRAARRARAGGDGK